MSIARLKKHVVKSWRPSWYEIAGVLTPTGMRDVYCSNLSNTHIYEPSGTDEELKVPRSVVGAKVATMHRQSDRTADPHPSPGSPPDGPRKTGTKPKESPTKQRVPKGAKNAGSSLHPPKPAPIVEGANGIQPTATLNSGKLDGSSPAVNLEDTPRPRRGAMDRAVVRMKECQPKRRKRGSGLSHTVTPSATQRMKAKIAKDLQQTDVDGKDTTEIEHPSVIPNKVISPITGISPHISNDPRPH